MSFIDQDDEYKQPRERELTLSTGTILGIFFGLVLLCGVFFGFGYNMGAKTRQPTQTADAAVSSAPGTGFGSFSKPSAGTFNATGSRNANPGASATTSPRLSGASSQTASQTEPAPAPIVRQAPAEQAAERTPPRPQPVTIPVAPATATAHAPAVAPPPAGLVAQAGPGTFMVQVAAVSHQEDAQLLVGALRSRGYTVAAHTAPGDSFYHVQVGPFGNKKDAEAMRQKLLSDGYNAVLK